MSILILKYKLILLFLKEHLLLYFLLLLITFAPMSFNFNLWHFLNQTDILLEILVIECLISTVPFGRVITQQVGQKVQSIIIHQLTTPYSFQNGLLQLAGSVILLLPQLIIICISCHFLPLFYIYSSHYFVYFL